MGPLRRRSEAAGGVARVGHDARMRRLQEGVRDIEVAGGRSGERRFMVLGGILVPSGLLVILLGWYGASRTSNVFEQIPYLISGGLLGLALVFLGAFLYFAHWLTRLVHEQRSRSAAVVAAVDRLAAAVERQSSRAAAVVDGSPGNGGGPLGAPPPSAGATAADGDGLVVTASGTLAHRPTCRVVAGKPGVRPVAVAEGLAPCRLCQPYD